MTDSDETSTESQPIDQWGLVPPAIEQVQALYARADHWPLEDAVRLLLALYPKALASAEEDSRTLRRVACFLDMARNCFGHSLPEPPKSGLPDATEPRVRPIDAVNWFAALDPQGGPQALVDGVRRQADEQGATDSKGQAKTRKLEPKQIHRHRCAGIAALLWQDNPDLPISKMALRPELQSLGCEGAGYSQTTIEGWIRDEKPGGRSRGRPRKNK